MKRKIRNRHFNPTIIILVIMLIIVAMVFLSSTRSKVDAVKEYNCDVKSFNLNTEIKISDKDTGTNLYTVKGNILKIVEDPLTLYDADGIKQAFAGDSYGIINQDTHNIYPVDSQGIKMVGNFNIFGDSYDIYFEEEKVARAEFNAFNTYGTLKDMDGNIIADYTSKPFLNDYEVHVANDKVFSERIMMMIFASYYSDQHADHK